MNDRQRTVQRASLGNEKQTLKALKKSYQRALKDIKERLKELQASPATQSKIYQAEYQKALRTQINGILDLLKAEHFKTVQEYLDKCYQEGFFGALYDLQGQGVPLVFPIDQKQMIKVLSRTGDQMKLSEKLYGNIERLKKEVREELSRGIANGYSYLQISDNLSGCSEASAGRAFRIVRTEGHRVQMESQLDTLHQAKARGAQIVKQWDSSLDKRIRPTHQRLDGQIRELEEAFEVDGHKANCPGCFGVAEEDINCRCALLQRAKWELDDGSRYSKRNSDTGQLVRLTEKDYNRFKKKVKQKLQKAFYPAASLEEAQEYANKVLKLEQTDYHDLHLDAANLINRELTKAYQVFGDLSEGGLRGVKQFPTQVEWYAAFSAREKIIYVRNMGISFSIEVLAQDARQQFVEGFWSTQNAAHAVQHEIGHAVQIMLAGDPAVKDEIMEIRRQALKLSGIVKWDFNDIKEHRKAAHRLLSYYALKDDNEMIAESVAEYLEGRPRGIARRVVEILLKGRK